VSPSPQTMEYLCVQLEGPHHLLVGGLLPMGLTAAPVLQTLRTRHVGERQFAS
jgi:hypothetical protein